MRLRNRIGFTVLLSLILTLAILNFSGQKVEATEVGLPTDFYFSFNGNRRAAGTEIEVVSPQAFLNVASDTPISGVTVDWVSSEPGVISLESTTLGTNYIKMVRKGPGYSTITANIKQGALSFSISIQVKVALSINYQDSGFVNATTTGDKILVFDDVGDAYAKPILLKYVDYTPEGEVIPVSGSAIGADIVTWESDNVGVAEVVNGKVYPRGAGNATIKISSATMSSQDKLMAITAKVVVRPKFSITFDNSAGTTVTYNSYDDHTNASAYADGIPSNFVINSNASFATNLDWEIIDCSNGRKIPVGSSAKMDYSISDLSGNVTFSRVKAGTYEIYAFADDTFNAATNAPYAYLKIIVPVDVKNINLVMGVGDTYSILENTNITGVDFFGAPNYLVGSADIASISLSDYVITANNKGVATIQLTYNSSLDLYDDAYKDQTLTIHITVIDGIVLSTTRATIYVKGTLQLEAKVTDSSQITWTSSDPTVATVTNGLVTGLKAGRTTITASQKINGIVKKATCQITVQPSVTAITLDPAKTTLAIGAYATIHATVTPNNLANVSLQWRSSNENVVKIVEENGLTATVQGIAGGVAVVTAINQENVVVGYSQISVQQPVTSIILSETSAVVKLSAKTLQIRATVYPENALNKTVTWISSNTSVATVDDNGVVKFLKPGTVTIIASSNDNPKVTAMCNLTIEVPVASIVLDDDTKTMYVGETARLAYTILPVNASNNTVIWSSSNPSVVSVDNAGRVTAKSVGTAIIILKTAEGGYMDMCTITVKSAPTSIKLDVTELKMKAGDNYTIKVTFTPKDATDIDLAWESSDTKIAIVDNQGKVTAKAAGTAIILARTTTGATAYVKLTVTQPVTGVLLNFNEKTIFVGQTYKLEASVSPSNASELSVTWKSSNTDIVTITNKGEITGVKGGVSIITCTTKDGGYTANCVVTVREPVTTISLDHDSYSVGVGKSFKLAATVKSDTATNQKVTWSSSNENVAVVNQNGKVTGVSVGYATITATATDGSEVEASCEVRVVIPVKSITLNATYKTLLVGESLKLKATVSDKNATIKTIVWTSSDPSIAMVDDTGNVVALKKGQATITAQATDDSGKKALCTIVVNERVSATSITLQDKNVTMVPGETKIVNAVINPIGSKDSLTWSTDNPGVAKVNSKTGKITAVSTGTANITVMAESGKTATVEVTVVGLNRSKLTLEQYTDYKYLEVEGYSGKVTWDVENSAICVVSSNGKVSSRAVGTTYVIASVNGRKLKCKVTVVKIGSLY